MSSNLLKSLFCKVIPQIYFFKGLGLIFLLLTSCNSTLYYRPVMLNLDRTYLPKPMLSDSSSSLYGLSGSYINTESNTSFTAISDEQQVYELNFTAAHIFKKVQIAYGGYLFWGNMQMGLYRKAVLIISIKNHLMVMESGDQLIYSRLMNVLNFVFPASNSATAKK